MLSALFNELKELAADASDEKRTYLLFRLSDMFFRPTVSHHEAEVAIFVDIFGRILGSVSEICRAEISRRVAPEPRLPHPTAMRLARDESAEVARPVLEASPVLTDDDLIELAGEGPQDRLAAIALRTELAARVAAVLVDRGDTEVVHRVTGNRGAAFHPRTVDKLLERARGDEEMQRLLVGRDDLTPRVMRRLLSLASETILAELREQGFAITPDIPRTVQKIMRRALNASRSRVREAAGRLSELAADVDGGRMSLADAVAELLRHEQLLDVPTLIAGVARLNKDMVFGVLAKGDVAQVLVLCRSLDLPWASVRSLLRYRAEKGLMPAPEADHEGDFEAIDPAVARRVLRFLSLRNLADIAPA